MVAGFGVKALRRRLRDPGEQEVLDRIALRKWAAAEREGKIQYLSKTEWIYKY